MGKDDPHFLEFVYFNKNSTPKTARGINPLLNVRSDGNTYSEIPD